MRRADPGGLGLRAGGRRSLGGHHRRDRWISDRSLPWLMPRRDAGVSPRPEEYWPDNQADFAELLRECEIPLPWEDERDLVADAEGQP